MKMIYRENDNKGIAIFISLILLFLISLLVAAVLLTSFNYAQSTEKQITRLRALVLAESGINYAYWKLRTSPGYSGSTITPDSSGYDVVITIEVDTDPNKPKTIKSKVIKHVEP